jgi:hypothetical protein
MSQGEKMANKILMGPKEIAGAKIMAMVMEGKITLKAGALRLGLSSRQAIRIKAAYQADGEAEGERGYCRVRGDAAPVAYSGRAWGKKKKKPPVPEPAGTPPAFRGTGSV